MRKDMQRVIITRARRHYGGQPQYTRNSRKDDDALCEPMSLRRGTKGFTDHLAPLWRLLDRRCGRPWNDVWSEICAVTDARTVIGRHLRTHVLTMIEMQPWIHKSAWMRGTYYVDEEGTFLKSRYEGPWRWGGPPPAPEGPPTVDAGDGGRYEQHAGIWYYVRDEVVRTKLHPHVDGDEIREIIQRAVKRQLDTRTLRRVGLLNKPPRIA